MELAKSLKALKDATGWSNAEIERQGILDHVITSRMLALLDEPSDIQRMVHFDKSHVGPLAEAETITPKHVSEIKGPLPVPEERADVLRKAAKERLTVEQTRELAEAFAGAETAEVKRKILETTYTVRKEEITLRARREVLLDQFAQVRERIPTLDERLFRRMKPLGKAVDELGLLAADRIFWDALSEQHKRAVLGYLSLALDKLQRVYDDLERREIDGKETRSEQFRLSGPTPHND